MRIVVDLQCCQNASRVRGIGRYALAMTQALASVGADHEWLVLLSDRFPDTIAPIRAALSDVLPPEAIHVCALPARIAAAEPASAWRCRAAQVVRIAYLEALAPDLVFVPSLFEGFHDDVAVSLDAIGCPVVVTVHDFIPLEEPWRYLPTPEDEVAYHRRLRELRRADLVLAISHYTARQAAELAGLDPARIVVAPNGVDPALAALAAAAPPDAPARLGITRPFVLNTSPIEHRKNVQGLIAGFALLAPEVRDRHQLVIAGRIDDAGRRHVAALAADAGLKADAVVTPGHLDEADLAALYGICAVFAFPSLSEGFGLPPLEAMACGAPVIAANATALPEVIGRPDMLVDPADPAALAAAIGRVLVDPARRSELGAYGVERAGRFTWEGSARTALAAFERLDATSSHAGPVRPPAWPSRVAIVLPASDDSMLRGKAATLASLLPVTIDVVVVGGGNAPDTTLDVLATRQTLDWFDRQALSLDAILYVTTATPDLALAERVAEHPGIVVHVNGWWLPTEPTATPQIARLAEGVGLDILPVAAAPAQARAWRAELGIADTMPLAIAFVASNANAPTVPNVTLHEVSVEIASLGERYRTLVTAADLLLTVDLSAPSLVAQLRADADHFGLPFNHAAAPRLPVRRVRSIGIEPAPLMPWSTALRSALAETRFTTLARVASRLGPKVGEIGPTSEDLARLAIALAINAVAGSSGGEPFL